MSGLRIMAACAAALLAACASRPAPAPRPAPPAAARAAPTVPPPPTVPAATDWRDLPLTPGSWTYTSTPDRSMAGYEVAGRPGFTIQCETSRRQLLLFIDRLHRTLRLRTSFGDHSFTAWTPLPAVDPTLDEIVFSRGRFAVEAEGLPLLVIPAWPEPARVVEDCRG
jgi:hypothetical protein